MEYEHCTTVLMLSTMGVDDASSTLTERDLEQAIERVTAERPGEGWERDGQVHRDDLSAAIPFRRPGSGERGRQRMRALAHLLFTPIPGGDGAAEG